MKISRLRLITAVCLFSSPLPAAEKNARAPKLDDLLRWPGDYSQICDAVSSSFPAPIPAFRSIMHGEAGFSKTKLAFIKKNRAALLPAVAAKLETVNLTREPQPQKPDPTMKKEEEIDIDPIGVDPMSFNTLLLSIIEETDAVEVLPSLLKLEEKYYTQLTAAEKDPKAPLPQTDGDGAGIGPGNLLKEGEDYDKLTPEREAEMDRTRELFSAQAVHRDILAVCVRLMRKAGYEPMLKSNLEKTYGKLLKAKWSDDEQLSKYKSAADIPAEEREEIKFDPVHKVAYMSWRPVDIPYTTAIRKEIVELTKAFAESRKK